MKDDERPTEESRFFYGDSELFKLVGGINPKRAPSIAYAPGDMKCPYTACGLAGRSTLCYNGVEHKECKVYRNEYYVKDFLDRLEDVE